MSNKKKQFLTDIELSAFCQQIGMIVNAGLPTYQGVSILMEDAQDEATRQLLSSIYAPMELGSPLHRALHDTGVFPEYMVHMIQLGEETGRLEEVLSSLSFYYEREANIHAGIRHAVTYPLVMILMMLVVVVVLIAKVLPVFSQIYEELGSELTGFARTLMNISTFLNRYMILFVILLVVLIVAAFLLYKTSLGKTMLQGNKLSMGIASGRFANCIYLALASGLDTDRGLELAEQLVNNPHMEAKIHKCREHIGHGEGFSRSVLLSGIFSKMYSSWISIGYTTGSMEDVMKKISDSYEEECDEEISHFISVLEPTLVIILSIVIGLILVSFLLPLLGIMSSIG